MLAGMGLEYWHCFLPGFGPQAKLAMNQPHTALALRSAWHFQPCFSWELRPRLAGRYANAKAKHIEMPPHKGELHIGLEQLPFALCTDIQRHHT